MEISEIIDLYRIKFKHSLVGKWATNQGTFMMQTDIFEFFKNGKGVWVSLNSGEENKLNFEWKENALLTIYIREEGEEEWTEVKYDFKIVENDVGKEVILCQNNLNTFYFAVNRVSYCGKL